MGKKIPAGGAFIFSLVLAAALAALSAAGTESRNEKPKKTIVLTFDDGPKPEVLKELLPILEKHRVPGTFFVVGWLVRQNREIVAKTREAGHEIENHSYGHENFKKLFKEKGAPAVKASLRKCEEEIILAAGKKPKFFRPPFWEINEEIEQIAKSEKYAVMKLNDPDLNTLDYEDAAKAHPAKILVERTKKIVSGREKNGEFSHVLVFHELPIAAKALDELIPYFKNQGYEFISLENFFNGQKSPPK